MLNDQALNNVCRGVCRRTTYETVLSHQDIVVQDAFAVGLKLPCSEAGMAVDQPENHSYKLRTSKSAD